MNGQEYKMEILGIGNAIVDVICKVDEDFIKVNNLTKGTMKLIFNEKEFKELLEKVKINDPMSTLKKYPHQLSGGQQQRLMIAMMISKKPKILICDEATSSLDSLVKKEIISLIMKLKNEYKMSLILITHNLNIVYKISDNIIFLKDGKIIEKGETKKVFKNPKMIYTKNLISLNKSFKINKKFFLFFNSDSIKF